MAKNDAVATADAAAANTPEMTLDEFCLRMSDRKVDGRIALIHGFAFTERQAGHVKDTEASFKQRFAEFANKPV
jgi:hypothetical protein